MVVVDYVIDVVIGARCRLGRLFYGYRFKNDSITNGVERFRVT